MYKNVCILRNKIMCLRCQEVIESFHEMDRKTCKCGLSTVDGGKSFLRRHGLKFRDLSEIAECPVCKEFLTYYQESALPGEYRCPNGCC